MFTYCHNFFAARAADGMAPWFVRWRVCRENRNNRLYGTSSWFSAFYVLWFQEFDCLARVPPQQNTWYLKQDNNVHTKATALCRQRVPQPRPAVQLSRQCARWSGKKHIQVQQKKIALNKIGMFVFPLRIPFCLLLL